MKITKTTLAVLVLGILAITQTVVAAEFLVPRDQKDDPNVSTVASESYRNLYAAGATVSINSPTTGDLYAVGAMVTVNGNVEQDLVVAGGNLNLNGSVGGDIRAAGGNISVNSPVGQDLIVAGGNVLVMQKAAVGADLVAAGGNMVIESEVKGKAWLTGGNITVNGKINGGLEVLAEEQLTFGPNSEVAGKVTYKGRKAAIVKEGAKIGTIDFTELSPRRGFGKALRSIVLVDLLAYFVTGWLFVHFLRKRVTIMTDSIYRNPWQMLGLGLVGLIITPVVAVLLFVTVIGYYLALVVLAFYFLILLLSSLAAAIFTGAWALKLINKTSYLELSWAAVLVGVIVLKIFLFIPIIGWLLLFVLFLLGLGGVVRHLYDQILESR